MGGEWLVRGRNQIEKERISEVAKSSIKVKTERGKTQIGNNLEKEGRKFENALW